jgi:alkylresorcinol/alkylpyrone synthase
MASIVTTASCFPTHYYSQETLTGLLRAYWEKARHRVDRLERLHENMAVRGRFLALPVEEYVALDGFGATNDAWIRVATEVGERALCELLNKAGLTPEAVAQLTFTTVTGVAAPSLDARLMNRIPFSPHLKRMPLFGLGCLGGAAGVARVADYLAGHPGEAAILLAVELCSLTVQPADISVANVIACGLFGDGAAAVLMVGPDHPLAKPGRPKVIASRSIFFPDTERVMGWDVTNTGFRVVLNAAVPEIARTRLRPAVDTFLAERGLTVADMGYWVAHPGGPKVITAMEEGLELPPEALRRSRDSLAEVGNISSVSILLILEKTLAEETPPPGAYGLMVAMGPAFCAELVLLQW